MAANTGVIIRLLRENFDYVQDNVATFLGISRELVSMYETGEREVPIEVLEKLSDLFGVETEVFFTEDPQQALAEVAFAFRRDEVHPEDLAQIAAFGKIVKNYLKIKKLSSGQP